MPKFNRISTIVSVMVSLQCTATPMIAEYNRINSGTYIAALIGYAAVDWLDFNQSPFVAYDANSTGGVAYGASLGYRFNRHWALEGGWVNLPTVSGDGFTNVEVSQPVTAIAVASWYGYLQGKFFWECQPHLLLNLSAGIAYREVDATPSELFTNATSYYYAPIASVGLQWDIANDWSIYVNYTYLPSFDDDLATQPSDSFDVPCVNFVALGVAYQFAI